MKIIGQTASAVFESIRQQVLSGALAPGQLLPPVRDLALALGINRNTVASAYKRLDAAGLAQTQGRRGTVVSARPSQGAQEGTQPGSALHDLASGNPDPRCLPDLRALLPARSPRLYGTPTIDPVLAALAHQQLAGDCPPGYALELAHGAVDAIERVLACWLVADDPVAVENPCFLGSLNTLRAAGYDALAVATDEEGMQVEALEQALATGARAVLLTPRAHNPTGASLSRRRARALRQVLERYPQVLVLVDDHFAWLSRQPYHAVIPPTTRRWALVRSLSKSLGPDLRLALIGCDAETAARLRLRMAPGTGWVSHLLQDAAAAALGSPRVAARMKRTGDDYQARRELLRQALQDEGVAVPAAMDGLNLWLPLKQDSQPLVMALAQRGWQVRAGEVFSVNMPVHGLRITTATLTATEARRFAKDLGEAMAG
ncbi:GntR family transcriptional regulator [Stenotrophomonas rhizophila]|uniref:MocR-like B6 salvage transcription factor PtsJ n=1 Tax=Stenotrophomonas rhizophila TaxID=216778 RepID=UPI000F4C55E2|nr:transcriptional regulator PtsJ [Stenotrophomonas rhizophila]ROP80456.1 GntR family transcriptional regulator [Stenotrophomonas rhizophila]